ncbi:GlsB/YeaQ/YmgE family stress response membrane protein [Methylomagnum sp.]
MNALIWIIFGGFAGWIASIIVGQNQQMGLLANIAVGIIGAFLGGWIADRAGFGGAPGVERPTSFISFITAVLGAVILLVILNLVFRR